jgi:hypothetical protein
MTNCATKSDWMAGLGGLMVVVVALALSPGTASATDVRFFLVATSDFVSNLNPSHTEIDTVYEAGDIKAADGVTTLGKYIQVAVRSTTSNSNFADGVAILPGGNVYFKLLHNFADGSERGMIVGGDGSFKGITGSIIRSGGPYQASVP